MKAAKAAAILIPLALLSGLGYGAYRFFGQGFRVNAPSATPPVKQAWQAAETKPEPEKKPADRTPFAILESHDGELTVYRDGRSVALEPKLELQPGDALETGPWSEARILWLGYGRTAIDERARLVIGKTELGGDGWKARVKLEGGRIWTRLERLLSGSSAFEVRAGDVVTAVRGTSFGVTYADSVKVQVVASKVAVSHVRDRAPTEVEQARGAVEPVEESLGDPVTVEAGKEIVIQPLVPGQGPAPALPEPQPSAEDPTTDPFVEGANAPMTQDELEGRGPASRPPEATGGASSTGGTADSGGLDLLNVTPQ